MKSAPRSAAVVGVCAAASGFGCTLAFLVAYLAPELRTSLEISSAGLGLIVSAFYAGTGLGSMTGRIAGSISARQLIVVNMFVVAVCLLAVGHFRGYVVMVIAALVSGAAYSFVTIGCNLAVSVASSPRWVGVHMGVKTSGITLVATVTAILAPMGADAFGFTAVLTAYAAVSVGVALFALVHVPATRPIRRETANEARLPRHFLLLPFSAFFLLAGSQPLLSYLVIYAEESGGYTTSSAGLFSAAGTAAATMVLPAVAARSDLVGLGSREWFVSLACCMSGAGALLVWVGAPRWGPVLFLGAVIGICGNIVAAGMTHALLVDHAGGSIARATGVTMTGYFAGALVGPALFGVVVQSFGGYTVAWIGCACSSGLAAAGYALLNVVSKRRPGMAFY